MPSSSCSAETVARDSVTWPPWPLSKAMRVKPCRCTEPTISRISAVQVAAVRLMLPGKFLLLGVKPKGTVGPTRISGSRRAAARVISWAKKASVSSGR